LREGERKKEGARGPRPEALAKKDREQLRDSSEGEGDALPGGEGEKPLNELDKRDMTKMLRRYRENYLKQQAEEGPRRRL
jgi:hypothetical protein